MSDKAPLPLFTLAPQRALWGTPRLPCVQNILFTFLHRWLYVALAPGPALVFQASYHDAKDKEAVYHSLASYELNFASFELHLYGGASAFQPRSRMETPRSTDPGLNTQTERRKGKTEVRGCQFPYSAKPHRSFLARHPLAAHEAPHERHTAALPKCSKRILDLVVETRLQ